MYRVTPMQGRSGEAVMHLIEKNILCA